MSPLRIDLRISDLPTTLLLLPLEEILLLPETALPVTLFDRRSLALLDAALAEDGLVGVLQARDGGGFYSVGCLCHVIDLGRSEEGHRMVLEGLIRFRIREELPPTADGVPRAAVGYDEFAGDLMAGEEEEPPDLNLGLLKEKIVEFGRKSFGTAGILETMSPRQVVLFMAQTAPFKPAEKQALLEASSLRDLVDLLAQLLSLNFLTTTPDTTPPSTVN
ncbi:MAG TPA: LON peptidase substrate-binding domain-containing protein [Thermoanaerobaculia bacterium]|jgi:Lon protease-like protein